jgi:DNA-binding NarL/FixJ family response regulator
MNTCTRGEAAIRVALVEDDLGTRQRLSRVIASSSELILGIAASNGGEILAWLKGYAPDVLLVDLGLPDMSGLEVIRQCRQMHPSCEVMVITMFGDEANVIKAIETGARGYLLKDGTEADLAQHVLSLRAGGSPMSPIIARQLMMRLAGGAGASMAGGKSPATDSPLSRREQDVLDLLARGFTYAETARHLGISVTTVHTHVNGIYSKLDVHNKAEAVYEARQNGWLP